MLTTDQIDPVVRSALAEDAPWGDVTSEFLIPVDAKASARLVAREPGVFSGGDVFRAAMILTDRTIEVTIAAQDGEPFEAGTVLAEVQRAVDQANERVSRAESIRKFTVLPTELTEDLGYLTPKLSIKRDIILRDFADTLEAMYAGVPVVTEAHTVIRD